MKWPSKHFYGLDPGLVGLRAFNHPSVKEWWKWLLEDYEPEYSIGLVTPCSNVKPYTYSPMSRKIRGTLRRLGLWDNVKDRPIRLEWLYFSDLLILVPYQRAHDYPACCYDVEPELVLANGLGILVTGKLREIMENLYHRGLRELVVFLPSKHLTLWGQAKRKAKTWPQEHHVRYTIYSLEELRRTLREVLR